MKPSSKSLMSGSRNGSKASLLFFGMGCSRKNPHPPDGWHCGNPHGRGGQGLWKSRREGGFNLKLCLRGLLLSVVSVNSIDMVRPPWSTNLNFKLYYSSNSIILTAFFWKFSSTGSIITLYSWRRIEKKIKLRQAEDSTTASNAWNFFNVVPRPLLPGVLPSNAENNAFFGFHFRFSCEAIWPGTNFFVTYDNNLTLFESKTDFW